MKTESESPFASRDLWTFLLDTEREADHLGEILREVTFVGNGFGCYSNFDVRDDAIEWPKEKLVAYWKALGYGPDPGEPEEWGDSPEQLAEWGKGYTFALDGFTVDVAWFWDGDGTLTFRIWDGKNVIRQIENHDCKKAYRWSDRRTVVVRSGNRTPLRSSTPKRV